MGAYWLLMVITYMIKKRLPSYLLFPLSQLEEASTVFKSENNNHDQLNCGHDNGNQCGDGVRESEIRKKWKEMW